MITANNLVFDYPGTRALDNISFTIRKGSITALVGPNGAGKTTLLRCLAALEEPASGTISMNGRDILADPRSTHRQLGYLSDSFGLYEELTVQQCLHYAAMSHGISEGEYAETIDRCVKQLEIADKMQIKAGALSRGQRQRLAIAQAIIHKPQFLLLDEPASGLDPEARHSLAVLFKRLQNDGMTLLVSSHILSELEEYSTDMLVLHGGRIIEHSAVTATQDNQLDTLEIRLSSPAPGLGAYLTAQAGITDLECSESEATFSFSSSAAEQHQLLKGLIANDFQICSFSEQRRNMQEAYLKTVKGVSK